MSEIIAEVNWGSAPDARADIHVPDPGNGILGVAVNLHGGGWYTGDKSLATRACAALADRGLVVVNANYPILERDPVPAMVRGAMGILGWVRAGGITRLVAMPDDGESVTLMGDSAGAHIALLTAMAQTNPRLASVLQVDPSGAAEVSRVVSWCGALALSELLVPYGDPLHGRFATYVGAITGGVRIDEGLARYDPVRWLDAGSRPTLAFTSDADFFHRSSVEYCRAADDLGAYVSLVDLDASHPAATHSWQLDPSLPDSQLTYDLTLDFIRR